MKACLVQRLKVAAFVDSTFELLPGKGGP